MLGFPFVAKKNGIGIEPAADMIIARLNSKLGVVHSLRHYTDDIKTRVTATKKIIYSCIGEINLVYAYDTPAKKSFHKIKTAVNRLLRATGLRRVRCSQTVLDMTLGTDLEQFALQGILMNGLKVLGEKIHESLARQNKVRLHALPGTYMHAFENSWNNLSLCMRGDILAKIGNLSSVKNLLKNHRKIDFDLNLYNQYKWVEFVRAQD